MTLQVSVFSPSEKLRVALPLALAVISPAFVTDTIFLSAEEEYDQLPDLTVVF